MSGLDSLILMDENVIMGDGDDTLEQAPAPSVVKDGGGNDAVLVQWCFHKGVIQSCLYYTLMAIYEA
jgi:hypothetical protein